MFNPNYPFYDVWKKDCRKLVESMRVQGLDQRHGVMTVFYSTEASPAVAGDDLILEELVFLRLSRMGVLWFFQIGVLGVKWCVS